MKLYRIVSIMALAVAGPFMTAQTAAKPAAKPAPQTKPVTQAADTTAKADLLDINTATPDQLMKLPGIADAYTKRIIAGRPYSAKNQLLTRGILPKATYEGIADKIIAKRVAK